MKKKSGILLKPIMHVGNGSSRYVGVSKKLANLGRCMLHILEIVLIKGTRLQLIGLVRGKNFRTKTKWEKALIVVN